VNDADLRGPAHEPGSAHFFDQSKVPVPFLRARKGDRHREYHRESIVGPRVKRLGGTEIAGSQLVAGAGVDMMDSR